MEESRRGRGSRLRSRFQGKSSFSPVYPPDERKQKRWLAQEIVSGLSWRAAATCSLLLRQHGENPGRNTCRIYCSSSPTSLLWYLSLSKMASPFHGRLASRELLVSGELRLSPSSLSNSRSSISMPISFFLFVGYYLYGLPFCVWPFPLPPAIQPSPHAYFLLPS